MARSILKTDACHQPTTALSWSAAARGIRYVDLLVARSLGATFAARALQSGDDVDAFAAIAPGVFPRRTCQRFCSIVEDGMVPIDDARELAVAWEASLFEVSGSGHNGVLSASDVIDAVFDFASEGAAVRFAG